jgi:hypothetical protein
LEQAWRKLGAILWRDSIIFGQNFSDGRILSAILLESRSKSSHLGCGATCLALQSKTALQTAPPLVRFDSDSYLIRVDNHALRCMANAPHLFEDLHLDNDKGQVGGINSGLNIAGQGTFKFNIANNDGKIHAIKIPDSLYVPNLKR